MTVGELLEKMTFQELFIWQVIFESKPFGELAQDGRLADQLIMQANLNRKKGDKPKSFVYYKPKNTKPPTAIESNDPEVIAAQLELALGGYSKQHS